MTEPETMRNADVINDVTKKRDCGQVESEDQPQVREEIHEPAGNNDIYASPQNARTNSENTTTTSTSLSEGPRSAKRCNTERSVRQSLSSQLRISSPTPPSKPAEALKAIETDTTVQLSVTTLSPSTTTVTPKSTSCATRQDESSKTSTSATTVHESDHAVSNSRRQQQQQQPLAMLDLESALHHVIDIIGITKEFLSNDEWVTYRVGDTGDASIIASWYRKSREMTPSYEPSSPDVTASSSATKASSSSSPVAISDSTAAQDKKIATTSTEEAALELWLADGLGDEDTPPSVHALLAFVSSSAVSSALSGSESTTTTTTTTIATSTLAGIALVTLAWDNQERVLRVEWFHVDPTLPHVNVLERKLWFRLSCIALITSCEKLVVDANCSTRYHQQNMEA